MHNQRIGAQNSTLIDSLTLGVHLLWVPGCFFIPSWITIPMLIVLRERWSVQFHGALHCLIGDVLLWLVFTKSFRTGFSVIIILTSNIPRLDVYWVLGLLRK